jgi:quinoprotein glucose dehydrogenase
VDRAKPAARIGHFYIYTFSGYHKFVDQDGYPATTPPWGTLTAVDMNTGKFLWRVPYGECPELAAQGMKDTGSESYGSGVVTASGLLMIGSSNFDSKFRVSIRRPAS